MTSKKILMHSLFLDEATPLTLKNSLRTIFGSKPEMFKNIEVQKEVIFL